MAISKSTLFRQQLELNKLVQAYLEDKLKYFIYICTYYVVCTFILKYILFVYTALVKNAYKDSKKNRLNLFTV